MEQPEDPPPSQHAPDHARRESLLFCAPLIVAQFVFEQHRRNALRFAKLLDDASECLSEAAPVCGWQPVEDFENSLLRGWRRFLRDRSPFFRQRQNQSSRIAAITISLHIAALDEFADDHGDGTLIGVCPLGHLRKRKGRRLPQFVKNKKLGARQTEFAL